MKGQSEEGEEFKGIIHRGLLMASQSESIESVEGRQGLDVRMTDSSPLVGEYIVSKKPARFGENYLKSTFPKEDEDTIMTGGNPVIEAESDDDAVDMVTGQSNIREAIKMLRDRRRDGCHDKLRVQRKIGRRKAKPVRQKLEKGKQRAGEMLEERGRRESSRSSMSSQPVQEYITPSGVPGSQPVVPGRAPPSPTLSGTEFAASTRTLLAQLKEIGLHPPTVMLPEGEVAMSSPTSSPALPQKEVGGVGKSWNGEAMYGQPMQAMGYNHVTEQQPQYSQMSPYEMRLSGSPSP